MGKLSAKDLGVKDIIGKLESFFLVPDINETTLGR